MHLSQVCKFSNSLTEAPPVKCSFGISMRATSCHFISDGDGNGLSSNA